MMLTFRVINSKMRGCENDFKGGFEIKEQKFYLNVNTGKLHIVGCKCCPQGKILSVDGKYFATEDEVISSETRYFSHCKRCFKD